MTRVKFCRVHFMSGGTAIFDGDYVEYGENSLFVTENPAQENEKVTIVPFSNVKYVELEGVYES